MKKGSPEERAWIRGLLRDLVREEKREFPPPRGKLEASFDPGVYIIRDQTRRIVHVGRTHRGKWGLHQRLRNHLDGQSSFVGEYLDNEPKRLREGFTYQCLVVKHHRYRALLEHLATGVLCPRHCGTGEELRGE